MARDYYKEHISGLHHPDVMNEPQECEHCDPWSKNYIEMGHRKGPVRDEWTEAWIADQKGK